MLCCGVCPSVRVFVASDIFVLNTSCELLDLFLQQHGIFAVIKSRTFPFSTLRCIWKEGASVADGEEATLLEDGIEQLATYIQDADSFPDKLTVGSLQLL